MVGEISDELTIWYAELPAARYTLYPAIGSDELDGAAQDRSTWCGEPVPLSATLAVGFVDEVFAMAS